MTLTAADLAARVNGLKVEDAARLLPVVSALVEVEAPDAPPAVADEAAVRCAGWLAQTNTTLGQMDALRSHGVSAFRASGARALVAPWVARGAAVGSTP